MRQPKFFSDSLEMGLTAVTKKLLEEKKRKDLALVTMADIEAAEARANQKVNRYE